jgi:hypothetical protein
MRDDVIFPTETMGPSGNEQVCAQSGYWAGCRSHLFGRVGPIKLAAFAVQASMALWRIISANADFLAQGKVTVR